MFNNNFLSKLTHDLKQIQKDVNHINQTFKGISQEFDIDKIIEDIKIGFHHDLKNIFLQIINNQIQVDSQEDIGKLVEQIDKMTGRDFEEFLAQCFQKLGYYVKMTPVSNDFGADLIVQKNLIKSVVQAKRYNKKVGASAVQEVVSAIKYYGASEGIVITNNHFTKNAYKLAKPNKIELWDRERLIDFIMMTRDS
ncbi:MAG: restriction endonuclease [Calothrix sp. MO_167.B12]|nr:restriction endonuclease [Calothrix sp. MO_167.B12]